MDKLMHDRITSYLPDGIRANSGVNEAALRIFEEVYKKHLERKSIDKNGNTIERKCNVT